jgi:hypothetical protein
MLSTFLSGRAQEKGGKVGAWGCSAGGGRVACGDYVSYRIVYPDWGIHYCTALLGLLTRLDLTTLLNTLFSSLNASC